MQPDYYAVLGVPPHADLAAIKAAFRARAMKAHPDHGGSDRQMFAVNEAWTVLSDPTTRRNYDGARERGLTVGSRPTGNNSPIQDLNTGLPGWLNPFAWRSVVRNDFARAEYGVRKFYGVPWPTVSHSLSGTLFLVAGTTGGIILAGEVFDTLVFEVLLRWGLSALSIVYGSWIGVWTHQHFRKDALASLQQNQDAARARSKTIVTCHWCGQRLRVPEQQTAAVRVICKSCGYAFTHPEERFSN